MVPDQIQGCLLLRVFLFQSLAHFPLSELYSYMFISFPSKGFLWMVTKNVTGSFKFILSCWQHLRKQTILQVGGAQDCGGFCPEWVRLRSHPWNYSVRSGSPLSQFSGRDMANVRLTHNPCSEHGCFWLKEDWKIKKWAAIKHAHFNGNEEGTKSAGSPA